MKRGDEEGLGLLWLLEEMRKRGVTATKLKMEGLELECVLTPLQEHQLTEQEMKAIIEDPRTPRERVAELAREFEKDLYAAS